MGESFDCLLFAVRDILRDFPQARASDDELVKIFSKKFCKQEVDLKALGIILEVDENGFE